MKSAKIMQTLYRIIKIIDFISEYSGKLISFIVLPLTIFVAYDVFVRYIFDAPTNWVYEMTWMQNGSLFILGGAYVTLKKSHIRVDILYKKYSEKTKKFFDIVVYLLIFVPVFYIMMKHSYFYAFESISYLEHSMISYWQPPLYPIKSILFIGLTIFFLSGVSDLLKIFFSFDRQ